MVPRSEKIFAAAGKAVLKGYNHGVQTLTQGDVQNVEEARQLLLSYLHEITGSRRSPRLAEMRDVMTHVHPGKDYGELEMVVKDLSDLGLTLTRLAQRKNRTNPDKLSEAKLLCDLLKHG